MMNSQHLRTHLKEHMVQLLEHLVVPHLGHLVRERLVSERARRVDKSGPVEFRQEAAEEVVVGLGGAHDELNVREREREVVRVAVAWDVSSATSGQQGEVMRRERYSRTWHASMLCVMRRTILAEFV